MPGGPSTAPFDFAQDKLRTGPSTALRTGVGAASAVLSNPTPPLPPRADGNDTISR
jgi:hypothetical protein